MKVEQIPIEFIVEVDRTREDFGDIEELAENLRDHGLQQPISVRCDHETRYVLIAGGRRLQAAKQLEWQTIDAVVRYEAISEVDLYELELIENVFRKDFTWAERCKLEKKIYEKKHAEDPNWSHKKTSTLLGRARSAITQDLELAEAMEVVPELANSDTQNEAWKKWNHIKQDFHVKQTVAKQREEAKSLPKEGTPAPTVRHEEGTKFVDYIENRYNIGDVFEGLKELAPIVDFMEVDPPYAVNLAEHRKKAVDKHIVSTYNELDEDSYADWLQNLASHLFNAMKDNAWGIFWYGSKWYPQVCWALTKAGFKINATPAIWTKIGGGYSPQPSIHLANLYENFIVFRKGNPSLCKPGRGNVFHYAQPTSSERIHPTQRPLRMLEELLEIFTTEASIICVPFLGSGNTLKAAYNLDRIAFGWDIDPIYKDRLIAKELEDAS